MPGSLIGASYRSGYFFFFLWYCLLNYIEYLYTVYPKKYGHGFVVICFVVVMQSFIMNSHEVFIHMHQGCFAGTGAIVRLPQCQWSKPDGYGKISQCITTTKHSKAKSVCIFLGIYCIFISLAAKIANGGLYNVKHKFNHNIQSGCGACPLVFIHEYVPRIVM